MTIDVAPPSEALLTDARERREGPESRRPSNTQPGGSLRLRRPECGASCVGALERAGACRTARHLRHGQRSSGDGDRSPIWSRGKQQEQERASVVRDTGCCAPLRCRARDAREELRGVLRRGEPPGRPAVSAEHHAPHAGGGPPDDHAEVRVGALRLLGRKV